MPEDIQQDVMVIPPEIESQGEDLIRDYKLANGEENTVWKLQSEVEKEGKEDEPGEDKPVDKEGEEDKPTEGDGIDAPKIDELQKPEEEKPVVYDFSTFGENYKSEEDIKTALTEREALQEKIKELESKFEETSKANPFAGNEDLAKLYGLLQKQPEDAEFYKQLMFGKVDAFALLKMDYIKNHPNRKDNEEVVTDIIQDRYPDLFDEDADPEDKAYKVAMARMEDDAEAIKSKYLSELDKIKVPGLQSKEEIESQRKNLEGSWKPIVETAFKEDIEYPLFKQGDKEPMYKHTFKKEELKQLVPMAVAQLVNSNSELTQDNFEKVYRTVLTIHAQVKMPEIMEAYSNEKVEKALAEQKKRVDNVSTDKNLDTDIDKPRKDEDEQDRAIRSGKRFDPNKPFG